MSGLLRNHNVLCNVHKRQVRAVPALPNGGACGTQHPQALIFDVDRSVLVPVMRRMAAGAGPSADPVVARERFVDVPAGAAHLCGGKISSDLDEDMPFLLLLVSEHLDKHSPPAVIHRSPVHPVRAVLYLLGDMLLLHAHDVVPLGYRGGPLVQEIFSVTETGTVSNSNRTEA